jgi:ABC-type lipoprotein export system ATPase subunit
MVVLKNLSKVIKIKKEEKTILKNISLTCPEKGLVLLYGNSGCGKTTLLNIMEGLDRKYEGTAEFFGKDLKKINLKKYLREDISIIFQESNFINNYSVLENIKLIFSIKGLDFDPFLIETRLKQFNIKTYISGASINTEKVIELAGLYKIMPKF